MIVQMLEAANVAVNINEMRITKKDEVFNINPLYGASLIDQGKAKQVHEVYNYYE